MNSGYSVLGSLVVSFVAVGLDRRKWEQAIRAKLKSCFDALHEASASLAVQPMRSLILLPSGIPSCLRSSIPITAVPPPFTRRRVVRRAVTKIHDHHIEDTFFHFLHSILPRKCKAYRGRTEQIQQYYNVTYNFPCK